MTQPPPTGEQPRWTPPDEPAPGHSDDPKYRAASSRPGDEPGSLATPPAPVAADTGEQPKKINGFAIAALAFGLIGGFMFSIILAIVALVQIRRNGDAGRGHAIMGLVAAAAWLVGGITFGIVELREEFRDSDKERSPSDTSARLSPRPGECFDLPADETSADIKIAPCGGPHDGQVILAFKLPNGSWPGAKEVDRQAFAGCEERMLATFKTRTPVENAEPYVLMPRRLGWLAGDRTVACALATDGKKLTAPIATGDPGRREWSELAVSDCFDHEESGNASVTVKIAPCTGPHTFQVTHKFNLPDGGWAGDSAVMRKAELGCTARQNAHFRKHPSPVPVDELYVYPEQEAWELGDREVVCYVTDGDGRKLRRSVMSR
ncbi:DUF4190 domain-containing protein [Actinomadura alba]|uniref:Septum formation family protein n=1 Tax=Actinomadura alba TaxID=406431 RepID=A0ABR7LWD5_9ACTN|nr:DUF4190 domain-containing protein [Actinomadura alba]MBC6469061.1 septum formation family protein [Actinomadura alba]